MNARELRRSLALVLILIAPAPLAAARASEPSPSGDLGRLQGCWTAKAGPKKDIAVTMTITGAEVVFDVGTRLGVTFHAEGRIKIDETASPKTVDWVGFTLGDGQDMPEILGLYELDGDALKMVNGGPNNARPSAFKKGDGALADIVQFRRTRPDQVAQGEAKAKK